MEIQFKASLPPIQGAVAIHGQDGIRVSLEVPDTDLAQAMKLVLFRGQVLNVTVEGEGEPVEVPKVPKREGERYSASQKLRQAIWSGWSVEQKGTFEEYYHAKMDEIIEGVNTGSL